MPPRNTEWHVDVIEALAELKRSHSWRGLAQHIEQTTGYRISHGMLYHIANGRRRPSRQLADALGVQTPGRSVVVFELEDAELATRLRALFAQWGTRRELAEALVAGTLEIVARRDERSPVDRVAQALREYDNEALARQLAARL